MAFIDDIMDYLGLESDIEPAKLDFRTNDKFKKQRRLDLEWDEMPGLRPRLRQRLHEEYDEGVKVLGDMLGRDLSGWLSGADRD